LLKAAVIKVKAVYISEFGGVENIGVRDVPEPPKPKNSQVSVRVRAAGLNRADLLQRRGLYPPPAGVSPYIPGLEFAGEVDEIGSDVRRFKRGDRVFGIVAGEAQAELLLTEESLLASVPENLDTFQAAAVPEVFITAFDAVFTQCKLRTSEWLLIHAIGSGVGLAALQLAKANGAKVIGTSRTEEKLDRCREFGLDLGIHTPKPEFAGEVLSKTERGANVVLDLVGGNYFSEDLKAMAVGGRTIIVGLTAGRTAEIDLGMVLSRRLTIIGTVLRARDLTEKAEVTRMFEIEVVPLLSDGRVQPNVDRVFPAAEVADAHRYLESNESFGKVVLEF
jgi:NADPH2:quinone reductase